MRWRERTLHDAQLKNDEFPIKGEDDSLHYRSFNIFNFFVFFSIIIGFLLIIVLFLSISEIKVKITPIESEIISNKRNDKEFEVDFQSKYDELKKDNYLLLIEIKKVKKDMNIFKKELELTKNKNENLFGEYREIMRGIMGLDEKR